MKRIATLILVSILTIALVGCDDDDNTVVDFDPPPPVPQGVTSITGDEQVTILWLGLWESDVKEYVVGWNDEPLGQYDEIGRVSASPRPADNVYGFVDTDVDNGTTYFYAVWAVDAAGHASEPSYEVVFDTPRPDSIADLYSRYFNATEAGFDLSSGAVIPWDANTADVFLDHDTIFFINGPDVDTQLVLYINAADLVTDIQDMGYTGSFDEIGWAPDAGWSEARRFEIIPGHTYVIWTWDERYAKMRVESISQQTGWVRFQWAYQPNGPADTLANRELSPPGPGNDKDNIETSVTSGSADIR